MCGRFTLTKKAEDLVEDFAVSFPSDFSFSPRYNIAATQILPAINIENPNIFTPMSWGYQTQIQSKQKLIINARIETIREKQIFKTAIENKRCIIPADGFYEWTKSGKLHQPYYIKEINHSLFGFAGIQLSDNKSNPTFIILTTTSNSLISKVHDRMPIMIYPKDIKNWLDKNLKNDDALEDILNKNIDPENLEIYPVSTQVNSVKFEDHSLIKKVSLQQTSLWD